MLFKCKTDIFLGHAVFCGAFLLFSTSPGIETAFTFAHQMAAGWRETERQREKERERKREKEIEREREIEKERRRKQNKIEKRCEDYAWLERMKISKYRSRELLRGLGGFLVLFLFISIRIKLVAKSPSCTKEFKDIFSTINVHLFI